MGAHCTSGSGEAGRHRVKFGLTGAWIDDLEGALARQVRFGQFLDAPMAVLVASSVTAVVLVRFTGIADPAALLDAMPNGLCDFFDSGFLAMGAGTTLEGLRFRQDGQLPI